MRKGFLLVLIVFSCTIISGCNNIQSNIENRGAGIKTNDTNINGQNIETKEVKEANDLVESKQEANNSEKIVTELENDDTNTFDSEFEFWHKESLFILNNSLLDIDVISFLGEPDEKSEIVVWEADGFEHQSWEYKSKGIRLDLIKNDNAQQIVNSIRLFSPCTLKTSRGIGIGSSKEVVLQEYKDEVQLGLDEGESDKIIVGTVYGGIIFTLDGDSVISIYIGASVE